MSSKKYERNNIDVGENKTPTLLYNSTENGNFQKENISSKVLTKKDLIENVNIPSYKRLNLIEHQINSYLSQLRN